MSDRDRVLRRVEFDSRLPKYFLVQSSFALAVTLVGIPLLPF